MARGRVARWLVFDHLHNGEAGGSSELGLNLQIDTSPPSGVEKEGRLKPPPLFFPLSLTESTFRICRGEMGARSSRADREKAENGLTMRIFESPECSRFRLHGYLQSETHRHEHGRP